MPDPICRIATSNAMVVAVKRFLGPPLEVTKAFDHVIDWGRVYNVEQWSPLVGVYYDHPGVAREWEELNESGVDNHGQLLAAEAWFPIPPDLADMDSADPLVSIQEVPAEKVAGCTHQGYPDTLGGSVQALMQWMLDDGHERSLPLHRQVYVSAPKGSPSEWVVEIQVPLKIRRRQ